MEENSSVETVMRCCVFWDVVDFPFPAGLSPDSIYKKMKSCLEKMGYGGGGGELKIKAYVSKEKLSDRLAGECRDAGIAVQGAESESARVHSMLVDIVLWAFENPANYWEPLNLMVISKDIKDGTYFLDALEALKYRYYNVLLALPHDLSSKELHTVPVNLLLGSLLDDGGPKSICQSPTVLVHKPKIKEQLDTLFEVLPPSCSLGSVPVFLDIGSFPSCDDVKPKFDLVNILSEVFSLKGVFRVSPLVWSYVDEAEKIEEMYRGYEWHRWRTIVVPTGDKYAKVTRMLLDILFSAMNNNVPKIMMLLLSHASTDTKCITVIGALEARGFKFILAPSNDNLPMKLSADYFELNCKKIIHTTGVYYPSSIDVVLFLDGKDWEDIMKPGYIFDNMRDPLERKGYCLGAISVYFSSDKSKNMEYDNVRTRDLLVYTYFQQRNGCFL